MILLDGHSLTLAQLASIADEREQVALAPGAADAVDAARLVVDRHSGGDAAVYGINTGFGSLSEVKIAKDALGDLQRNLLRSHAAGVDAPLPARAVRAMMGLRANVLTRAHLWPAIASAGPCGSRSSTTT